MKHDLLFIGMEDWDGVWRRSQNLIARLAKRNPDKKILFVESPFGVANAFKRGKFSEVKYHLNRIGVPRQIEGFNNVFAIKPIVRWPVSWLSMKPRDESYVRAQVHKAANYIAMGSRYLWIKPYYGAHFMGKMNEAGTLYDVGDDWTVSITNPKLKAEAIREDDFLTKNADQVVVVSDFLYQKKISIRPDIKLIPNGADIDSYQKIGRGILTRHKITENWSQPIIGHTGTLHDDRTDVELIIYTARQYPKCTIALVGPSLLSKTHTQHLAKEPNIKLIGSVPYSELPSIMESFTICIVPQKRSQFTKSQNPLKLWEYLASGLPIVSTPIAGFSDYPNLLKVANTRDEFIHAIKALLDLTHDPLSEKRRSVAEYNTWDQRVDTVEQIFSSHETET